MRKISLLLLLSLSQFSFGQFYKSYDWESEAKYEVPSDLYSKESTVGIKQVNIVEYTNKLKVYSTTHKNIFVRDEKGINRNNKVYIQMSGAKSLVNIKARTIAKDGSSKLLDKSNIKEIKNVEEYGDFKIFAIEGVQPESNIEVIYTLEKEYYPFGYQIIQQDYPILNAKFIFLGGDNNYNTKAYRADSDFKDVDYDSRKGKMLNLDNLPAMIDEDFATPNSNKVSVAYQCFANTNSITDMAIWNNVVRNVCSKVFPVSPSKRASKDVKELLLYDNSDIYDKVNNLDNFVKSEFTISKSRNPELSDIGYVLKNRVASSTGILQAYGHYLTAMDIEYQVVITANRYIHNFDPYFFTPRAIQDFLIYIPEIKKYISPDRLEYRVGEAPFNVLGNMAIFVDKSLRHYPKKLKENDPNFSHIKRITDVTFDDNMSSAILDQYQEYYGHWAVTNRAVLQFSAEPDKEGLKDYLTGSGIEDKKNLSYVLKNDEINQAVYNIPFIVESKISSESMVENAGDSYIFLVGNVIGTQSELYQEEERVNPILSRYPNVYNYTITVNIPDGYTADGLDDLNIYKELKSNGKIICKFESDYEISEEGNVVISIEEFYKEIDIPAENYAQFREVINAASDFNKASILISKAQE